MMSTDSVAAEQLSLLGEALAAKPLAPVEEPVAETVSAPSLPEGRELAPMLQHYVTLKRKYPEHLLLFQVGDFYEIFFDDAPKAADALSIRLTSRNKDEPQPIPMCGVPIHALDNYLPRLLRAGFSVVIISQVEESRNKKGPVQREISRIVTPGVRYEGDGLDEKQFNYLAALLASSRGAGALAFVDVSTGWLRLQEFETVEDLTDVLRRVRPAELILPSTISGKPVDKSEKWWKEALRSAEDLGAKLVFRPFDRAPRSVLARRFNELLVSGLESANTELQRMSLESLSALQSALQYVEEVSFGSMPKLARFTREEQGRTVFIDAATRRNLELTETRIDGEKRNSLLAHIDYTKTAMGSRLLAESLLSPSADRIEIEKRLDAVAELIERRDERATFRDALRSVRDIDRLISRITGFRAVPRDLGSLRDSLAVLPRIGAALSMFQSAFVSGLATEFDALEDVTARLIAALEDELPVRVNEGGIFRAGFHPELDRLRQIGADGNGWLVELEARERERTGIPSLKVKFNNIFGYFLEVTKAHQDKVPSHYERRQTLVNAERFVLPELKEYEASLLSAKARQIELEKELFVELRSWVALQAGRIQRTASVLSLLDVMSSHAHLAETHNFRRPIFTDGRATVIARGRHPVVERVLGAHQFIPNDTCLDDDKRRFAVLSGPNMGGKSTYLRQVGLIQLLAQAGSFVPAESAELGIVDRIFTRIGAADDLARGDSTFMVEMREAGTILRKAGPRSLVLIDEIGRGTATKDGLALATAIAEWLHDVIGCRTIFATHFHELTELAEKKEGVFCLSVGVIEDGQDIQFTHRIEERAADRSYGIEVARLAGLPEALLKRARELLEHSPTAPAEVKAAVPAPACGWEVEKIIRRVEQVEPNKITPIQALVELSELKDLMRSERKT